MKQGPIIAIVILIVCLFLVSSSIGGYFIMNSSPEPEPEKEEETAVKGCTSPEAENYNPDATEDDGSCRYPTVDVPLGGACRGTTIEGIEIYPINASLWKAEQEEAGKPPARSLRAVGFEDTTAENFAESGKGYHVFNTFIEGRESCDDIASKPLLITLDKSRSDPYLETWVNPGELSLPEYTAGSNEFVLLKR